MSLDHGWTHSICERCWVEREPEREPSRLKKPQRETCCYCGNPTWVGIYVRDAPDAPQHCVAMLA